MTIVNYPKISIITPVYNQVKYIEQTILSVLNQCYPNLEYIIIDGGSTDGTVDIIKKYESQLSYWISEPDNGMYDALQKGFERSTGEIMGWLNADDLYFKGCFSIIAKLFMQKKEVRWVTGSVHVMNSEGVIIGNSPSRIFNKYQFLCGDYQWVAQESTLWHRSLWEGTGSRLNTDLKYAGDFELWLRFIQKDTLHHLSLPIGIFRRREGQLSSNVKKYEEEVRAIYENLKISEKDKRIIDLYNKKRRIARLINKTGFLDGNRMVHLKAFKDRHMTIPKRFNYDQNADTFNN